TALVEMQSIDANQDAFHLDPVIMPVPLDPVPGQTIYKGSYQPSPDDALKVFLTKYLIQQNLANKDTGLLAPDSFKMRILPPATGVFSLKSSDKSPGSGYLALLISY